MFEINRQFIEVILIPAFIWLVYRVGNFEKELSDFQLKVAEDAKNYATNDALLRMESKIDDLRNLIIEEFKSGKKVGKK